MEPIYEIVQEQLHGIALDLPTSERIHYVDTVMEAITVKGNEAQMMYALYKDIQKINDVDFGKIPDSRGDITKYAYYTYLQKSIDTLSSLTGADSIEEIGMVDKVHTILLNYRRDFMFGYQKNLNMITSIYETLALSLYGLIDIAISEYTKYLKLDFQSQNLGKFNARDSMLIAETRSMIKLFENGSFSFMMKSLREASARQTQEGLAAGNESVATEGLADTLRKGVDFLGKLEMEYKNPNKGKPVMDDQGKPIMVADANGTIGPKIDNDTVKNFAPFAAIRSLWSNTGKGLKVILIMIAFLFSIRALLSIFGKISGYMSGCARNQAALLRAALDARQANGQSVSEVQRKFADKLDGLADLIDRKFNKAEKQAAKDIAASNRENFGTTAITAGPIPQGVDFGF